MISFVIILSVNATHISVTVKCAFPSRPSSRAPWRQRVFKEAQAGGTYIFSRIYIIGGGSAAVELAPAPPHRWRVVFLALVAGVLGALPGHAIFDNRAQRCSGALPGHAVWLR